MAGRDRESEQAEKKARVARITETDPAAPLYHFIAPEGACRPFDPNGAIFWNGRYHLFYIFQNPELERGVHCWGHASSSDLLHWTYHPAALTPNPGDPESGIFSGCALADRRGRPTLVYFGIDAGICIATAADDELIRWRKSEHNPVIPIARQGDPGWGVYNVFDPHVWLEGETYYAILGGKVKPHDLYDTAYLFRSDDLVHWEYLRPFYNPNPHWTGEEEDCACPDFFPLGHRYVLACISHPRGARYYLGRYQSGTFVPEEHHRMNWPGGPCFAPESLLDARGRRLFWAWALDQRKGPDMVPNQLGVMTLPRVLSLAGDGSLRIEPAPELEGLHRNPRFAGGIELSPGAAVELPDFRGDCAEIAIEAVPPESGRFVVSVRRSAGGLEETGIVFDAARGTLAVDTRRSGLPGRLFRPSVICGVAEDFERRDVPVQEAPFSLGRGEALQCRIFLDRSMLEVFANGRQCITQRIYPSRSDSLGVAVAAEDGEAVVRSIRMWDMAPTNRSGAAGFGKER